jgi:hypothetical protein
VQKKEWFMLRHIKGLLGLALILVVVSLISASSALGQTGTTSLHGTILDKSGAAIVGAKVNIVNAQQGVERTTTTGSSGEYDFVGLAPGAYSLTVEMTNFRKYEQRNLQLLVSLPATANVVLEVGSATQTVEVSAQVATLNTTDASLGNAFGENQLKSLPLEGRNVPDCRRAWRTQGTARTSTRTTIRAAAR